MGRAGVEVVKMQAMADEIVKIAAVSTPAITAPPSPGGLTGQLNPTPPAPVTPQKVISKGLRTTNLQKTNYTSVGTKPPTPNVTLTSAQKALPPPVVR